MRWSGPMWSVLAVVVAGCDPGSPEVGGETAPIRGGVDDVTDVAVVGVVDDRTSATCTGTLIAPDLILTAQHCVAAIRDLGPCSQGTFGPPGAAAGYFVTTRPAFSANPADYHGVAEVRLPPGGDRFCGRDIVLLRLARTVAAAEAAPIAPRLDPAPAVAEVYAAVGYGATDDNGTAAGQRRRRDGLKVACAGAGCASSFSDLAEWRGEAGVCIGDSGGPALAADGRVLGVASRGSVGCVDPVYTAVAAHADWLLAEAVRAAAVGGYPTPAWADTAPAIDAGADAVSDAAGDDEDDGGCSAGGAGGQGALAMALLLAALVRTHRRR